MFYKTEDIVAAAKRSEFFPTGQSTFADPDDLVAFANEEMQIKLVPLMLSAREDYFLAPPKYVPLKNSLDHYAIPERAIGNDFKDIFWVPKAFLPGTTTVDQTNSVVRTPLPKQQVHDARSYIGANGMPSGFYMRGDEAVLVPVPSGLSGTEALAFYYFMRPNRLTPTSNCAKITAISTASGVTTCTVDTDLTSAGTATLQLASGALVDIISATSPFRPRAIDVTIQTISSTQFTFTATDIQDESGTTTPVVGDYICTAQTTNIPFFPQELHPILSEMICFRALKALGLLPKMQACAQNIKDMLQGTLHMISNRVESEPDVVFDSAGFLSLTNYYGLWNMTR